MDRKEAIEVIKKNYPHVGISGSEFETALRELVPELAESEDERIRKELISFVNKYYGEETKKEVLAYLKKQKEQPSTADDIAAAYQMGLAEGRKEQKPVEWSEEDKKMLDNTLDSLRRYQLSMPNFQVELQMRWLKSLRPQPHWKPSEEQMKVLKSLPELLRNYKLDTSAQMLEELYEELKKL